MAAATRSITRPLLIAALTACAFLSCFAFAGPARADALQPEGALQSAASDALASSSPIDNVRALIEALPAPTNVVEADGEAIGIARAAYDALDEEDQRLLDTETNRAALGTTQSYGRVLELAEAGFAVLHEIDNSTTLANGVYTTSVSCAWNRGKSASKQDREWSSVRVVVQDSKAFVTLRINSSTYSKLRISGQVFDRSTASASDESLFTFPICLGTETVFLAYSDLMAAEIAYNVTVSVPAGATPDAATTPEDDPIGGEGDAEDPVGAPLVTTDPNTGRTVVEKGTFTLPDVAGYMFRMVEPVIITSDGTNMYLSGTMKSAAYSHLFLGTAEQAKAKSLEEGIADGSFIVAEEVVNDKGETVGRFTFPLESLDQPIIMCVYSVKNQHWVDQELQLNLEQLRWHETDEELQQVEAVAEQLENLPARNTIVPDNPQHEAVVRAACDAYESLNRLQKTQVPARLVLLMRWDESMFDLGFNTEYLPLALVDKPYDGAIYLSGKNGTGGKHARITSGALPAGLSLEIDEAGLWASFVGTPSATGSYAFTVELSNDTEMVSKEFTVHVGYAPTILTEAPAVAHAGVAYEQAFEANAYPDATWSLVGGELPAGLVLIDNGEGSNTARLSGTSTETGTFTFTLACDNFANGVETRTYTLVVDAVAGEAQVKALTDALDSARDEMGALRQEQEALASAIEQLKKQSAQMQEKNTQLEAEIAQAKKQNAQLETSNAQSQKKIAQLEKKATQLESHIAQLEKQHAQIAKQIAQQNAKLKKQIAQQKKQIAQQKKQSAQIAKRVKALEKDAKNMKAKLPSAVVINTKTVTAAKVKAALKKANNPYATSVTLGKKVATIKKGAFAGTDVRTLVAKTTKLTKKSTRGALKGSKVKTIRVKVAASKAKKVKKAYKKAFTKKNAGRKVSIA